MENGNILGKTHRTVNDRRINGSSFFLVPLVKMTSIVRHLLLLAQSKIMPIIFRIFPLDPAVPSHPGILLLSKDGFYLNSDCMTSDAAFVPFISSYKYPPVSMQQHILLQDSSHTFFLTSLFFIPI